MYNFEPRTVIFRKDITSDIFILRIQRNGLKFKAGQCILVALSQESNSREYSIYSSPQVDYLEILVKVIPTGKVSPKLQKLDTDDILWITDPTGFFTIKENYKSCVNIPYLFLASGTGISPFHSIVNGFPLLKYQLVHGVRNLCDAYESHKYQNIKLCLSKETIPQKVHNNISYYQGRLTEYLKKLELNSQMHVYLCGNDEMINESTNILLNKGIPDSQLFVEVYF